MFIDNEITFYMLVDNVAIKKKKHQQKTRFVKHSIRNTLKLYSLEANERI